MKEPSLQSSRSSLAKAMQAALFGTLFMASICLAKPVDRENYRIHSGDTIEMSILQEPDMKSKQRVSIDGSIHLPLIGKVAAAGYSIGELQAILYESYNSEFLVKPQIALLISDYAERRVRVRGKVNRPGFVVIPPEERFTILDVIAAAGDLTASGNERKVELHTFDERGNATIRVIDLSQASSAAELSSLYLKNNDQVVVPEKLF